MESPTTEQQATIQQASPFTLEDHLKKWFGYNTFRPYQKEIIETVLKGQDVVAILPTGAGKSICYQLPAMVMPGTAVVISPLISLMQDQVQALIKSGVSSAYLNSSLPPSQMYEVLRNLSQFKILYVAPERLADPGFIERIKEMNISFFVIDEAHCISQWGHSFRPDYRQLSFIKRTFPNKPLMALTATATLEVERDIMQQLSMENPHLVKGSFDRPNLMIRIRRKNDPSAEILAYVKKNPEQSGIVYAATRKNVDSCYELLKSQGINVGRYHAGLTDAERHTALHDFIHDKTTVMVATVAFGMGINKPDIRYIIHHDMPKTIEQYYQEIGRAGRDGLPADCLMFFDTQDLFIYHSFLKTLTDPTIISQTRLRTEQMFALCNTQDCRRVALLKYFSETYPAKKCVGCDNCVDDEEREDATIIAQKILSCVFRLNQAFGIRHVIDVLRGSKNQNVLTRRHDTLSTYNLMGENSEAEIKYYIDSLLSLNLLKISGGEYPVLQWTEESPPVIRGEKQVEFRKKIFREEAKSRTRGQQEKEGTVIPHNGELFNLLRELRQSIAQEEGLPRFAVFADRSLYEMAAFYPTNETDFLLINGVGRYKYDAYGTKFLGVIKEFCLENGIVPTRRTEKPPAKREARDRSASGINPTMQATLEMFRAGKTIAEIAEERSFAPSTISSHLALAIEQGIEVDIGRLVPPEHMKAINTVIDSIGPSRLTPIKLALPETITYEEIRLVTAHRNARTK